MKDLDYKALGLKEISEAEGQEIQGGTRLSYVFGYLSHWMYDMIRDNEMSPWNAMGSK